MGTRIDTQRRAALAGLFGAFLALAVPPAFAEPRLAEAILSDDEEPNEHEDSFAAATAQRLYLTATLAGIPASAKVRCTWTRLTPAEQKLEMRVVTLATQTPQVTFSYAPPTGVWPVGQYRIDLELDGKLLGSIPFRMQ